VCEALQFLRGTSSVAFSFRFVARFLVASEEKRFRAGLVRHVPAWEGKSTSQMHDLCGAFGGGKTVVHRSEQEWFMFLAYLANSPDVARYVVLEQISLRDGKTYLACQLTDLGREPIPELQVSMSSWTFPLPTRTIGCLPQPRTKARDLPKGVYKIAGRKSKRKSLLTSKGGPSQGADKFRATCSSDGIQHHLGTFSSVDAATKAVARFETVLLLSLLPFHAKPVSLLTLEWI
jgi:hypothetical protein